MDSLKDAKQKTNEFISPSLILTPPTNYNFRDYPGFDLGVGDGWMGLSPVNDGDEWLELLNGIDVDELLEESPPKKKPHLCLSLKRKNLGLVECSKIQLTPLILPSSPDDLLYLYRKVK